MANPGELVWRQVETAQWDSGRPRVEGLKRHVLGAGVGIPRWQRFGCPRSFEDSRPLWVAQKQGGWYDSAIQEWGLQGQKRPEWTHWAPPGSDGISKP